MPSLKDLIPYLVSPKYLISPELQEAFLPIKFIFIFFSLFFLGGIIWFLFNTSWWRKIIFQDLVEILTYKPYLVRQVTRRWNKISRRLERGREAEYKLAVIEADGMLNHTLEQMGYIGETLGERLEKVSRDTLSNIENVWQAHKIRNNIVHDPNYKLTLIQTRKVLAIFETAFHDLGVF